MIEVLKAFLGGAGGASLVAGLFAVWQWWLKRKAQKEDREEATGSERCRARGLELQAMETNVGNLTVAMRAILYDRIKYLAKSYLKKCWISVEDYEDLKRMHSVYHNELKGNGFLDGIMEEIEHLEKRVT